jgi:hypothetical protein
MHAAVLCEQWLGAPLAWMAAAIMLYIMRTVVACQCRISCTAPVSGTPAAGGMPLLALAVVGLAAQAVARDLHDEHVIGSSEERATVSQCQA